MSHRIPKINELIRQELDKVLLKEMNLPADCLITITNVDTSRDLGQSKINISILPVELNERILAELNNKAGFFQHLLAQEMVIRKVPKLRFFPDFSQKKALNIDQLIDKIHKDK